MRIFLLLYFFCGFSFGQHVISIPKYAYEKYCPDVPRLSNEIPQGSMGFVIVQGSIDDDGAVDAASVLYESASKEQVDAAKENLGKCLFDALLLKHKSQTQVAKAYKWESAVDGMNLTVFNIQRKDKGCPKLEYPEMSKLLKETGSVTLKFLINGDGYAVVARVDKTSGFPRLDEAALVGLAGCTFLTPVDKSSSWAILKYTWKL